MPLPTLPIESLWLTGAGASDEVTVLRNVDGVDEVPNAELLKHTDVLEQLPDTVHRQPHHHAESVNCDKVHRLREAICRAAGLGLRPAVPRCSALDFDVVAVRITLRRYGRPSPERQRHDLVVVGTDTLSPPTALDPSYIAAADIPGSAGRAKPPTRVKALAQFA